MTNKLRRIRDLGLTGVSLCVGFACATAQPPHELVQARAEYTKASSGPATRVNPAGLYQAKKSLDWANSNFDNNPDSPRTKDAAYIALRKIQLAEAQAAIMVATEEKTKAEQDKAKATETALAQARAKLSASSDQLKSTNQELQNKDQQLQSSQQALEAEKAARAEADRKAEEATANLAKIAAIKQEQRGLVITLSGSVLFRSNKSTLLPNANAKLDEVARALKSSDAKKFIVEGHTDSRGSETANQNLSERRAESVRAYLVAQGVPTEKISAVGYGKTRPVADNDTAEGRADNRRVEIIISPPDTTKTADTTNKST